MFTICIVNVIIHISVHEWSIHAHRTTTLYFTELRVFLEYQKNKLNAKSNQREFLHPINILFISLLLIH